MKTVEIQTLENSKLRETISVPENMIGEGKTNTYRILNSSGDDRISWDKNSLDELQEARRIFYDSIAKGMKAYRVGEGGKKSSYEMKSFDPHAEEVIFVPMPAVVGG